MKMSEILRDMTVDTPAGADAEIDLIENDSRNCREGALFIAASGYVEDAHPYVASAYANGCRDFLVSRNRVAELSARHPGARFTGVSDLKAALASAARNFYKDPSSKLKMVGITGTSGKTTTAFAVFESLRAMGLGAGLIGTIEYRVNDEIIEATNTTPDILALNRLLDRMVRAGAKYCVMEVSSHSLQLGRIQGLSFDMAAYTNFSQDHLDFHKTMDEYFAAKLLIFELLESSSKGKKSIIVNLETSGFEKIEERSKSFPGIAFRSLSLAGSTADYASEILELSPARTAFRLNGNLLESSMIGMTNAYNFSMAAALLMELGFKPADFSGALARVSVRGRMEKVPSPSGVTVVVDYAHKPDALEKVLQTLRGLLGAGEGRLITVFGCGGDRDRSKRPVMGSIAARISDTVIITSDNPRTEDPMSIIAEIEAGVKPEKKGYEVIENRALAIRRSLELARPRDVVLIAGKGHEDYQIIGKTKHHFSDREEVIKFYREVH